MRPSTTHTLLLVELTVLSSGKNAPTPSASILPEVV